MLVQPTSTQLSCQKYQLQNQNQSPMFKGKLGEQFLKTVGEPTVVTENDIMQALTKLGIGTMGFIAMSKVQDIIESLFKEKSKLQKTINEQQQQITSGQNELQHKRTALEAEFNEKQKALETQFDAREKALQEKEQALTNVKNLLTQAEIDKLISTFRVLHNIKEPDIKTYNSFAEQCVAVIDIINKSMGKNSNGDGVKVQDLDDTTITRLVKTLQNDDKKITAETLDILGRITTMRNYSIPDITIAMNILKNPFGDIDFNKSASFIALYSLNEIDIKSVCKNIIKVFNILPESEYTLSDAQKALGLSYTPYVLNDEYITITEDYPADKTNALIEFFDINENEMLKYVTCFQKSLYLNKNKRVKSLPNLKHIGGTVGIDGSAISRDERDKILNCMT